MKYVDVVVLNADQTPDSVGEIVNIDGIEIPRNPVFLLHEFQKDPGSIFGTALLRKEGNTVLANMEFFPNVIGPELLEICYPAIGGAVLERNDNEIAKCIIKEIGLSTNPNADSRIPKLGKPSEV